MLNYITLNDILQLEYMIVYIIRGKIMHKEIFACSMAKKSIEVINEKKCA